MKKLQSTLILSFILFTSAYGQDDDTAWFDFWIGKWEVSWTEAEGKLGKGTNTVTKILDDKVIQENFKIVEGANKGYLGTSMSVYSPKFKIWHQAYADNQGGYINFIGERSGDTRIFKTDPSQDKSVPLSRMRFYEIKKDSLMWDWEFSQDGGKTWTLNWRITYKRIGEG
ncbi:MAG: hypothetical protein ABIS36_16145 [Chryseolinea sp.]